jgi:maltose alpha-D-glucosyltransferase / alpha-amylase
MTELAVGGWHEAGACSAVDGVRATGAGTRQGLPMIDRAVSSLWWKNAVVYCLDVETFMDANGDGIGDLQGLTQRIDYLAGLGITCLWLMPLYPTPNRDDGYDITDFYDVDPRLGTLGDFVEFVHAASERGIRVIVDLVVNHTSRDHPWFQSARSDPDSPYRDWYVWREDRPETEEKVIFPDEEDSNWAWDEQAQRYYLHRFYSSQPDLNVANPEVVDEIHRIMGFWLELGVSGFRVDAVPYLIEETAVEEEMPEDPHAVLEDMRWFLARRSAQGILLGEVNLSPGEREAFFGDAGDEMTGLFDFLLSGRFFLALERGSAAPLVTAIQERSTPPKDCQWFNFIRNHDELNLSRLPDDERDEIMDAYAPEAWMRIFGRGIRRRLGPMLDGDPRRLRLIASLMLVLPGTPVLWYGDEIGMGEDPGLDGRMSVRTPMQWSHEANAGFSHTDDPGSLIRPVVSTGPFGYEQINVAAQRLDRGSLLNWYEQAIRIRKESPELGRGEVLILQSNDPALLVLRHSWLDRTMVTAHNLADREAEVALADLGLPLGAFVEVFADTGHGATDEEETRFTLEPHGFRWMRAT